MFPHWSISICFRGFIESCPGACRKEFRKCGNIYLHFRRAERKKQDIQTGCPVSMERATRLELASGIPQTACGDLQEPCRPPGSKKRASRADSGGSEFFCAERKKQDIQTGCPVSMERATRLELATSTLARWRSTG